MFSVRMDHTMSVVCFELARQETMREPERQARVTSKQGLLSPCFSRPCRHDQRGIRGPSTGLGGWR